MAEPITDTPPVDDGANALPPQADGQPADNTQDQAQVTNDDQGAQALPDTPDEKLVKFAESHGIELDSPSSIKAAKIAMDNQASFQQAQQKASQLDKSTQEPPTDNSQVKVLQNTVNLMSFKQSHPDWEQFDQQMGELLEEVVPTPYGNLPRKALYAEGLLSLDDVYKMAKGNASAAPEDTTQVLQSIANKQRAGSLTPNANSGTPETKKYNTLDIWSN